MDPEGGFYNTNSFSELIGGMVNTYFPGDDEKKEFSQNVDAYMSYFDKTHKAMVDGGQEWENVAEDPSYNDYENSNIGEKPANENYGLSFNGEEFSILNVNYLKNIGTPFNSDYVYAKRGIGLSRFITYSDGLILDKEGGLYIFDELDIGIGLSGFQNVGVGIGYVEPKMKAEYDENLGQLIPGFSIGGSGTTGIIGGGYSFGIGKESADSTEFGVETSAGISLNGRYVRPIISKN